MDWPSHATPKRINKRRWDYWRNLHKKRILPVFLSLKKIFNFNIIYYVLPLLFIARSTYLLPLKGIFIFYFNVIIIIIILINSITVILIKKLTKNIVIIFNKKGHQKFNFSSLCDSPINTPLD